MSTSSAGPPASFSPSSGSAFLVVDGTSAVLNTVADAAGSMSAIGPRPSRVLEETFADDRVIGLFRAVDLDAANATIESLREPTNGFTGAGRICAGHDASGEDAPAPNDERELSYLVVPGFISNFEVYGAYLRGPEGE